jgi:hypothetical protein
MKGTGRIINKLSDKNTGEFLSYQIKEGMHVVVAHSNHLLHKDPVTQSKTFLFSYLM